MASMNFSSAKQTIKPPQRGIFPLDHDAECKPFKERYLSCLKEGGDKHHVCRDFSKEYLQCRMDRNLMASEDLDRVRLLCGIGGVHILTIMCTNNSCSCFCSTLFLHYYLQSARIFQRSNG